MDLSSKVPEANDAIWLGFLSGLAVSDIVLYHKDKELLSHAARDHKVFAFLTMGIFALHIIDVFGRYDPFNFVGLIWKKGVKHAPYKKGK